MGDVPVGIKTSADLPAAGRLSTGWSLVAAITAYCLIVGALFHQTVASIVTIWMRSQTYAHGFLILPIVLWLLWRQRARFAGVINVRPQPWALVLIMAEGLAWLIAHLVGVQVIQQLMFVGTIIAGVWAIAGTELVLRAAFPLFFLFLAVPMGAGLIPPLMSLTADTTEFLLRSSAVPVYREGMYLILPTGTWSVIEECSGVRYLIASVTLGLLYAYLTYYSFWRRALFVLAAILIPIVANSLRAYGVVILGHFSDMHIATGDDHLFYGWLLFGVVLFLMFWIGGFWQQRAPLEARPRPPVGNVGGNSLASLTLCTTLAIVAAGAWPVLAQAINRTGAPGAFAPLTLADAATPWRIADRLEWDWQPVHQGADRELNRFYTLDRTDDGPVVGLFLRQHLQQARGIKLVNSTEPWRPDRAVWWVLDSGTALIDLGVPVAVNEATVTSTQQRLLIWSWYRIDGRYTANPYIGKLLEARQHIFDGRRSGTRVFIATPASEDPAPARKKLQNFIDSYWAEIEASLDDGLTKRDM